MYEYKYDAETGGIILTDTTSLVSKEPRPVYAQELDYLGVDDYPATDGPSRIDGQTGKAIGTNNDILRTASPFGLSMACGQCVGNQLWFGGNDRPRRNREDNA